MNKMFVKISMPRNSSVADFTLQRPRKAALAPEPALKAKFVPPRGLKKSPLKKKNAGVGSPSKKSEPPSPIPAAEPENLSTESEASSNKSYQYMYEKSRQAYCPRLVKNCVQNVL